MTEPPAYVWVLYAPLARRRSVPTSMVAGALEKGNDDGDGRRKMRFDAACTHWKRTYDRKLRSVSRNSSSSGAGLTLLLRAHQDLSRTDTRSPDVDLSAQRWRQDETL